MSEEKPWQWLIDELTEDVDFWIESGFDKERPEAFEKIKQTLEKAKLKQKNSLLKGWVE